MQPTLSLIRQAPSLFIFLFDKIYYTFCAEKSSLHPVSYIISRLRILHGSIDIFHVFRAACLQPCVPRPSLFPGGLSEISSLAFFHLLCYNPNRLTECSMRGSALVLRSIQLLDDEDQIAREPVFRAERIPERIDRPMPRIHVRGLSAFCLKVIFTACCRRHAFSLSACFFRIHGS